MDQGMDFLKSQIANAAMQHEAFVKSLEDHESGTNDPRLRELYARFIPLAREDQIRLEDYERTLGADQGMVKKAIGKTFGIAKDLADKAQDDDFYRLVEDIVMARQSEDTFRTFREAGKTLDNQVLQQLGDKGERDQDQFVHSANRLVQQLFVERVRGTAADMRAASELRADRDLGANP